MFLTSDYAPPPLTLALRTLGTAAVIGVEGCFILQYSCFWTVFNMAEPGLVFRLLALLGVASALQLLALIHALRLSSIMLLAFLTPLRTSLYIIGGAIAN